MHVAITNYCLLQTSKIHGNQLVSG